jgi:hypothetical protein
VHQSKSGSSSLLDRQAGSSRQAAGEQAGSRGAAGRQQAGSRQAAGEQGCHKHPHRNVCSSQQPKVRHGPRTLAEGAPGGVQHQQGVLVTGAGGQLTHALAAQGLHCAARQPQVPLSLALAVAVAVALNVARVQTALLGCVWQGQGQRVRRSSGGVRK